MTSLGASRRRPFHPRSMTRPCRSRLQPSGLNQLVPVLKGAAAVSATWQPCLYLASTPPRALATSSLSSLSRSDLPFFLARLIVASLLPFSSTPSSFSLSFSLFPPPTLCPSFSLSLSLRLFRVSCPVLLLSLGDINNATAQASNFHAAGSNDVSVTDKGTPGTVPS